MKKKSPFSIKKQYKNRFSSFKSKEIGSDLRELSQRLSASSRKASIADRIKMRKVISSLLKSADILEGRGA